MSYGLSRIVFLCALGCAALGRSAIPAPADLQDGPPRLGLVEQERFRDYGRRAQELFRLRVPVSTILPAEPSAPATEPAGAGLGDESAPPAAPSTDWQTRVLQVLFPIALIVAWAVVLRRIFAQNAPSVPKPAARAPAKRVARKIPSRPRARKKPFVSFASAFRAQLSSVQPAEPTVARMPRGRFFRQPLTSLSRL